MCKYDVIVKSAESLLAASHRILGSRITNSIVRATFFRHFCAGEDPESIKPTIKYLERNGIGSILDYCAEADMKPENDNNNEAEKVQCRTYDYKDEDLCDAHMKTFSDCIEAVKKVSPTGFAAIKITALVNPILLERMSVAIRELQVFFSKIDVENKGYVTNEQFHEGFNKYFTGIDIPKEFLKMDVQKDNQIDYIEWTNTISLEELHLYTNNCKTKGPLAKATLNEEERKLMETMRIRVEKLAILASDLGVRLMIDAEHSYFQPAIDNITTNLAKKFNRKYPVIFNTYQMYLKDSLSRLRLDMDRAKRGGYHFAAKLVRGAYMDLERARALKLNIDDPILPNITQTHLNYDFALREAISAIAAGQSVEIMIASHNQQSIELALATMSRLDLPPSSNVYFGQLLGMADHLTFTLGQAGYKAYKYVPYGKVDEVIPYLIRRAQENSGMLGGATKEIDMISGEILRRLKKT
jgi:proline dehydrogenase